MSLTITKLDKAKAQLVLDHPFFASLILRKPLVSTHSVPTAAVNAHGQIFYNPDFIDKLDVQRRDVDVFFGEVCFDHSVDDGSKPCGMVAVAVRSLRPCGDGFFPRTEPIEDGFSGSLCGNLRGPMDESRLRDDGA